MGSGKQFAHGHEKEVGYAKERWVCRRRPGERQVHDLCVLTFGEAEGGRDFIRGPPCRGAKIGEKGIMMPAHTEMGRGC